MLRARGLRKEYGPGEAQALATVFVVAALTSVPARLGGRRPVTEAL
jgi:hypothetical protein